MLSVRGISKGFANANGPAGSGDGSVIKDVSFEVQKGQYFVLLGSSGVGKSVLLQTIAGLIRPDAGQIVLDGKDITNERIQNRKTALVFQNSTLFPHMTVYENIAYPLKTKRLSSSQIRGRLAELSKDFKLDGLFSRRTATLCGGEAQRVSLARAVASEPRCLLLDEPISSLDAASRPKIRGLLRRINAEGLTIVHVTHDYTEAVSLATDIAVMEAGRIAQRGTVEEIFKRPRSEFVARFVGIKNFFKGRLENSNDGPPQSRRFSTASLIFSVLTDTPAGAGFIMLRSEDVTISEKPGRTSARNNFQGRIAEIIPAAAGVEVIVGIGPKSPLEIAALITAEAAEQLGLACGKTVWVSFKASAVRYIEG